MAYDYEIIKTKQEKAMTVAKEEEMFLLENLKKNKQIKEVAYCDSKDDQFKHRDIVYTTHQNPTYKKYIDVKGKKHYSQNDTCTHRQWIELQNAGGYKGWSQCMTTDYFAFVMDDGYYFVTPYVLKCNGISGMAHYNSDHNVDEHPYDEKEKPSPDEYYRLYNRRDKDLIYMIPDDDIKNMAKIWMDYDGKFHKGKNKVKHLFDGKLFDRND